MSIYEIEQVKIDILEEALKESVNRREIFTALDGIFQELEGNAIIAKQCSGNPMLSQRTKEHATIVAERIYNFREYLQTKSD